jgi:outer membrane protein assembly factor BamB
MRVQQTTLIAFVAMTFLCPASAFGKRRVPRPVLPIVWQGVEYRAPLDVEHMGHVQAFELRSHRKLWETKVYHVWIIPLLEEDVQWVFVSGMQVHGGKLLVQNENGKTYRLDLKTGRIEGAVRYWLPWFLTGAFLMVVAFFAWIRNSQQFAPPNGGLAIALGNSGVTEGPPSVS